MQGYNTYELGDVRLQSGAVLRDAQLAYATYGTLNAAADNAVLLPTFYTGTHIRNEALFGPGRAIDPARHFVVSINLFGNGYSSSPSNAQRSARRSALSASHALRQCRLPAPPAHRAARRSADRARPRLVAGGHAGLSMGGSVSRHGRSDPALLRRRALLAPQPCLPRRSEGGLAGGRRLERRQLREAAGEGLESLRPRLRRLGLLA